MSSLIHLNRVVYIIQTEGVSTLNRVVSKNAEKLDIQGQNGIFCIKKFSVVLYGLFFYLAEGMPPAVQGVAPEPYQGPAPGPK